FTEEVGEEVALVVLGRGQRRYRRDEDARGLARTDGDGRGELHGGALLTGCRALDLAGRGDQVLVGRGPGDARTVDTAGRQVQVPPDVVEIVDDERVGRRLGARLVGGVRQHGDREGLRLRLAALAQGRGQGRRCGLLPRRRARDRAVGGDDTRVRGRPLEGGTAGGGGGKLEIGLDRVEALEREALDVEREGGLGVHGGPVGYLGAAECAVVGAAVLDRAVDGAVGGVGGAADVVRGRLPIADVAGRHRDLGVLTDLLAVDVQARRAVGEGVGDVLPHAAGEPRGPRDVLLR